MQIPSGSMRKSLRADPRSFDSGAKSWVGQSSEHDADHCETDKRRGGSRVALEVAGEAPTVADPGERSLDDPAFGKHEEVSLRCRSPLFSSLSTIGAQRLPASLLLSRPRIARCTEPTGDAGTGRTALTRYTVDIARQEEKR
jgi:hypothetical protein